MCFKFQAIVGVELFLFSPEYVFLFYQSHFISLRLIVLSFFHYCQILDESEYVGHSLCSSPLLQCVLLHYCNLENKGTNKDYLLHIPLKS